MKLIVFFGIYIGYLLIASKVFQKFELSEYEKRCTEGAWFEISVNLRRLIRTALRRRVKMRGLRENVTLNQEKSKKEYEDIRRKWLSKHIMASIITKSFVGRSAK